ncbi:hypothetical protein, partial [Enterococcus faecium]|uniref:hypothetical protein n=1 Tax=Enterococcus faecium TaxID=1352 RepID=UPI001E4EF24E
LSLPFNSEPQGAISKNSSFYFSFGWAYYRRCKLLNTVYQEVLSLPFNSEPQGTISKNSFSCFINIVTCGRGVGRRTPFKEEVVKKLSCIKK